MPELLNTDQKTRGKKGEKTGDRKRAKRPVTGVFWPLLKGCPKLGEKTPGPKDSRKTLGERIAPMPRSNTFFPTTILPLSLKVTARSFSESPIAVVVFAVAAVFFAAIPPNRSNVAHSDYGGS